MSKVGCVSQGEGAVDKVLASQAEDLSLILQPM